MTKVWGPHGLVARATSMVSAPSIIPARTRGGARRRSFRAAVLVIASEAEADAADARSTVDPWEVARQFLIGPRQAAGSASKGHDGALGAHIEEQRCPQATYRLRSRRQ
jgi:hypothetical protein